MNDDKEISSSELQKWIHSNQDSICMPFRQKVVEWIDERMSLDFIETRSQATESMYQICYYDALDNPALWLTDFENLYNTDEDLFQVLKVKDSLSVVKRAFERIHNMMDSNQDAVVKSNEVR